MMRSYMRDSVVHVASNGLDQWGNPETPTSTTRAARIEEGNKVVIDEQGEKVVSMARIMLPANVTVSLEDNFTFDGLTHTILSINKRKDFRTRYLEIAVK